jgi:hypothetical protein
MDYLTAGCHKTDIKMQYSDRNPQTCLLQGLESTGRLKVQWDAGILTRRLVGTSVKVGCKVISGLWTITAEMEVNYERFDADQNAHERL